MIREGIESEKIVNIGSPMKEVIEYYEKKINLSKIIQNLKIKKNKYFLVSLHREENVDDPKKLKLFLSSIEALCKTFKVKAIISTHYRTSKKLENISFKSKNLVFKKPFGFLDYMFLQKNSFITLSDSGTLSEESSILRRSSIHLRHCTERPEGLENGAIIIGGSSVKKLTSAVKIILEDKKIHNHSSYDKSNVSKIVLKSVISCLEYYK